MLENTFSQLEIHHTTLKAMLDTGSITYYEWDCGEAAEGWTLWTGRLFGL